MAAEYSSIPGPASDGFNRWTFARDKVGSTICYAFMQAVGLVNDHTMDCFRHRQLR
jgi:3-methyladenine DNA glycosylase Tag